MSKITRDSLLTLEAYSKARPDFRAKVIAHKRARTVPLGEHVTLLFEDEMTMRYQIQEMLRIERIFEDEGIAHELETYNALVPDGRNLKATMMIEYVDEDQRRRELGRLIGIEDRIWLQVEGEPRVYAIADEDLERETAEKTSAVHFLRFDLSDRMARELENGAALALGVDHPNYAVSIPRLPQATRATLAADLD